MIFALVFFYLFIPVIFRWYATRYESSIWLILIVLGLENPSFDAVFTNSLLKWSIIRSNSLISSFSLERFGILAGSLDLNLLFACYQNKGEIKSIFLPVCREMKKISSFILIRGICSKKKKA